ncbi:MAG: hypothetical protein ACN4G0_15380 [Polyangiales bacterium]
MPAKRKNEDVSGVSEATSKLSRLLETEEELEAMLKDVRREAEQLVASARASADALLKTFESDLEAGDGELQRRVARDRDRRIEAIREETRQATERLRKVDDDEITELAKHILDLILNRSESRGSP